MPDSYDLNAFLAGFSEESGFSRQSFLNLIEDTNEDVALKILARFQISLKECEEVLRNGLQQKSSDMLWKICHKMAGTSDLLGFHQFAKASKALSHNLKATSDIESHLEELDSYLKNCVTLKSDLSSHCPNLANYLE